MSTVGENVINNVTETTTPKPDVLKQLSSESIIIILIICVMIIIILVTIYIIRLFKSSNLKETSLIRHIVQIDNKSIVPMKIPGGNLAVSNRGQEFTYTCWLYLGEYSTTINHKLLYQRGALPPTDGNVSLAYNANPVFALDKGTNTLYFCLATSKTVNVNSLDSIVSKNANYMVTKIDYVPLHRWVFISMVLRDNVMTIYMDGDIYSVVSTVDMQYTGNNRPIVSATSGDAYIGDVNYFTSGFISKLNSYNYALTQDQIKKMYNNGPMTKSILSWFGIGNYGIRSPVYNLQDANDTIQK